MLGRAMERVVRAVLARPATWAVAATVVMVLGALGATRITLEDDARALIMGADPEVARLLGALSDFTAVDQLLLHLDGTGATGDDVARRLVDAAEWIERELITSGRFERVRFRAEAGQQLALVDALMGRRFVIDPRPVEAVLDGGALERRLAELKATLLGPRGMLQKEYLLRDPLGSVAAALADLETAPGLSKLDASSGTFFSRDGKSLLILAAPAGNPFGGGDAAATMSEIRAVQEHLAERQPDFALRAIGAHRYTQEAQAIIMRDVHTSAALTGIVVLVIFMAFFRRVRLIVVALPPLAFGACFAAGLASLWGHPIHGIVLAFAAACLGLSIDYTIHLLAAASQRSGSIAETLPAAARTIAASLLLAAVSTCIGLFALGLSHVDALRQMAVLAAGAVVGAFVGNLVWVPIILPLLYRSTSRNAGELSAPAVQRGPWSGLVRFARRRPGAIGVMAVVLALVFGGAASQATVDGDLRNLDTRAERAQRDEAAFAEAFGDPTASALVLIEAADLDTGLARAERVTQSLRAANVERVLSPTFIAPSRQTAALRLATWCRADAPTRLDEAARPEGFRPGSFSRFADDLAAQCEEASPPDPRPALDAFAALLERPLVLAGDGDSVRLAVAFETAADRLPAIGDALERVPDANLVHRTALNRRMVEIISAELPLLGGLALLLVGGLLFATYREIGRPVRALAPCVLAMLATLGILTMADVPINLMNLCVFPLLAGLGIDYGILMTDVADDASDATFSERAFSVTVAAATTLAGFGTLAIARYYAIATIGRSVILAVTAAALFSLVLPVALGQLSRSRRPRKEDRARG